MRTKPPVFLSASIPEAGRAPFDTDIRRKAIQEAILALVAVCHERALHLVFGGHPAISPLVDHASRALGSQGDITIYQSRLFDEEKMIPKAALGFPGLVLTETVRVGDTFRENLAPSISRMRTAMLDPRRHHFVAGVFIGGMEGIRDEFAQFAERYPDAPRFPIPSTGGAVALDRLVEKLRPEELDPEQREALARDLEVPGSITYRSLFRVLLPQPRAAD